MSTKKGSKAYNSQETRKRRPSELSGPGLSKAKQHFKKHLLIVDDDTAVAMMYKRTLKRHGFEVTATTHARRALELFESDPTRFDIVIADRVMPGLNGYELAKKLLTIRPEIPIVITSGYDEDSEIAL